MEDSAESSFNNPISPQGCGPHSQISIRISPTTGGDFSLSVSNDLPVDELKKIISKRLKVPRDRICLLFREKQLQDGNILQHGVADGSKVTLLPNVETGLVQQRSEIGIMQALESLNDSQINEFLCGKAPLNLSMRLGDHMMLIQLQLSTVTGTRAQSSAASSSSTQHPPSLTQASRNLQHTLRRLSADVFSGRATGRRGSVYSGTFSGALNPALQDPRGRPRKDVATIVHILNDLLCSAPDLKRVARSTDDPASSSGGGGTASDSQPVPSIIHQHALDETAACGTSSPTSEDQNSRTRGKMERLRLVMGERREKRRQRKQKPYSMSSSDSDSPVTA